MNEIKYKTFGSLLSKVIDNRGKTCPISEQGTPLIATNCISNEYLYPVFSKVRYVDDETYSHWFRGHPEPGDMIFVTKGSPGRVAWVPNPVGFCIAQDMVAIRANAEEVYPKYLFAALRSSNVQQEIEGLHVGTLIPHFKKGDFNALKIPLPPKKAQEYIGNQYFDLSLKIDLLHRQNKTLEAMAETLFRKWFVEEAQDDWEEVKIKDFEVIVTDYVANGSFASLKENVTLVNDKKDYALFIRSTDLKNNFSNQVYVTEHSYNFLSKTKLYGGEVIISSVGEVGNVFRCPKFNIPMTLGNNVIMLKSEYNHFFYLFFKSNEGQKMLDGITSGSVQEKFNKTSFRELTINYPSIAYIRNFDKEVKTYFDKIDFNQTQIRTLEKLRDTLLPKLMSGEVRVEYEN